MLDAASEPGADNCHAREDYDGAGDKELSREFKPLPHLGPLARSRRKLPPQESQTFCDPQPVYNNSQIRPLLASNAPDGS